jgi:hypothetical protein
MMMRFGDGRVADAVLVYDACSVQPSFTGREPRRCWLREKKSSSQNAIAGV